MTLNFSDKEESKINKNPCSSEAYIHNGREAFSSKGLNNKTFLALGAI